MTPLSTVLILFLALQAALSVVSRRVSPWVVLWVRFLGLLLFATSTETPLFYLHSELVYTGFALLMLSGPWLWIHGIGDPLTAFATGLWTLLALATGRILFDRETEK